MSKIREYKSIKILITTVLLILLYACGTTYKFPEPIGGIKAIQEKLYYTDEAKQNKIDGKMLVKFTVLKDSSVKNVSVIKPLGFGLDEIAVIAVKSTKFEPGEIDGEFVEVEVTMPIIFIYE